MADAVRVSISIDKSLYDKLERLVRESKYENRSEFIRDLVRGRIVEDEWRADEPALGTIMLLYNHDRRNLTDKLTKLQHGHHHAILATTHVHVDHDICAEMIMVRDKASHIRELADLLGQQRGVLHASLSMSSLGERLK